ncbi:YxlC family protein [Paenibacillus tarimensis]|uniref:YxlC family protein n=1 Tax=Paenibacillus tarimensis TaxID=416012 RepID=UPI001F3C63F6|nr:YxlC family protein [Paenibacillus tarimensis]MCF2945925.1 YxlC family protein [Paenibacillus tarimensis]
MAVKRNKDGKRAGQADAAEQEDLKLVEAWLQEGLADFDEQRDINVPSSVWFEELALEGRRSARRKLLRDLAIFWLTGGAILSVLMLMLSSNVVWFIVLQVLALIGGTGFAVVHWLRGTGREVEQEWMS